MFTLQHESGCQTDYASANNEWPRVVPLRVHGRLPEPGIMLLVRARAEFLCGAPIADVSGEAMDSADG